MSNDQLSAHREFLASLITLVASINEIDCDVNEDALNILDRLGLARQHRDEVREHLAACLGSLKMIHLLMPSSGPR